MEVIGRNGKNALAQMMEKIFPKLRVNDEYGNTIMIKDIK